VRVNAVAPAVVKTRFAAALYEGHEPKRSPAIRWTPGRAQTSPGAVAFLASRMLPDNRQTLVIDGGVTLAPAL